MLQETPQKIFITYQSEYIYIRLLEYGIKAKEKER